MSQDIVKSMTDLYSNVSFGGGGGGGGGGSVSQTCIMAGTWAAGTTAAVGNVVSKAPHPAAKVGGNVAIVAAPTVGVATAAVCRWAGW